MWFSAIACMWCVVVGIIVSLIKPEDHRRVDRRLISPALTSIFACWPKVFRDRLKAYTDEIGVDFVSI
jgi:hypothetical protein